MEFSRFCKGTNELVIFPLQALGIISKIEKNRFPRPLQPKSNEEKRPLAKENNTTPSELAEDRLENVKITTEDLMAAHESRM